MPPPEFDETLGWSALSSLIWCAFRFEPFMQAIDGAEIARRARRWHVGQGTGSVHSLIGRHASNAPCVLHV